MKTIDNIKIKSGMKLFEIISDGGIGKTIKEHQNFTSDIENRCATFYGNIENVINKIRETQPNFIRCGGKINQYK